MKLFNIFIKNDKPQIIDNKKPKIKSPNFTKLRDWVKKDRLKWHGLSSNPRAIYLLEENLDEIDWKELSKNPAAIELLKENPSKIDWGVLSVHINEMSNNTSAIEFIKANMDKIKYVHLFYNEKLNYLFEANPNKVYFYYLPKHKDIIKQHSEVCPSAIDWDWLSADDFAISVLEANQDKINWKYLSGNPAAIHLLEANPDKIDWKYLSGNPAAIHLLEANPSKIDWGILSGNPAAIKLLEANPDKIDWSKLSGNPAAISLLKANQDKIDWHRLSGNPAAIELLEANPDKIYWDGLSLIYQNPAAIHLLEANPDKICWWSLSDNDFCNLINKNLHNIDIIIDNEDNIMDKYYYSSNYELIYVLEKFIHKLKWYNVIFEKDECYYDGSFDGPSDTYEPLTGIKIIKHKADCNWYWLSQNPAIFTYDYVKIKETHQQINKEVCEVYWHPKRMNMWLWQADE